MADMTYKNLIEYGGKRDFTFWWRCDSDQLENIYDFTLDENARVVYRNTDSTLETNAAAKKVGSRGLLTHVSDGYSVNCQYSDPLNPLLQSVPKDAGRFGFWVKFKDQINHAATMDRLELLMIGGGYGTPPELSEFSLDAEYTSNGIKCIMRPIGEEVLRYTKMEMRWIYNNSSVQTNVILKTPDYFFEQDIWYFIECIWDVNIQTFTLKINNEVIDALYNHPGEEIISCDHWEESGLSFINAQLGSEPEFSYGYPIYLDNIMISSNPDENLWNVKDELSFPGNTTNTVRHGIRYSEITDKIYFHLENGETVYDYDTTLTGELLDDWAFIQYGYDIANKEVSIRVDDGEVITQTIQSLPVASVAYSDLKFYIEPDSLPPVVETNLFWWRCDNFGGVPIIEEPYDHNPLELVAQYSMDSTNYVETEKQMVGNGCLKFEYTGAGDQQIENIVFFPDNPFNLNSGRLGFYIYISEESFNPSENEDATFSIALGDLGMGGMLMSIGNVKTLSYTRQILMFGSDYESLGHIDIPYFDAYFFLEVAWGFDNHDWKIYINGLEQEVLDKLPLGDMPPVSIFALGMNTYSTLSAYLDNIIIDANNEKNLYSYRGFDSFTSVIPSETPIPDDDIIFWWTGMKDEYGLPAIRYYEGKDYIKKFDGPWFVGPIITGIDETYFKHYSKWYSSSEHPSALDTSGCICISQESSGDNGTLLHENVNEFSGNTLRVGFWFTTEGTWTHYPEILLINSLFSKAFDISLKYPDSQDLSYRLELNYDEELSLSWDSIVISDPLGWHWFELSINADTNTFNGYIDNNLLPVRSITGEITTGEILIDHILLVGTARTLLQNLMISTDPTINFYEKGYHLLTEYPQPIPLANFLFWFRCESETLVPTYDYFYDETVTAITWDPSLCTNVNAMRVGTMGLQNTTANQDSFSVYSAFPTTLIGGRIGYWARLSEDADDEMNFGVGLQSETANIFLICQTTDYTTRDLMAVVAEQTTETQIMITSQTPFPKGQWHFIQMAFKCGSDSPYVKIFMDDNTTPIASTGSEVTFIPDIPIQAVMGMCGIYESPEALGYANIDQILICTDPDINLWAFREIEKYPG